MVHAHPDDEASKGAGTVARYHDRGVRTVLVCCTGGEAGDILNPAMDTEEVRRNLPDIRLQELDRSAKIIGYDEVVLLGYRDSGMPDTQANRHPEAFANAPAEEAVGRLVAVIRRTRPQVIVTYPEDQSGYPHPDHLRVHEITVGAWEAAGDPGRYPEAGEPFEPLKLYYTVWPRRRWQAMHDKFLELGLESPFDDRRLRRIGSEEAVTTSIDIAGYTEIGPEALKAHATQVDPTSPMWFGLPPEVRAEVHPFDDYRLFRSRVGGPEGLETDLFAGIPDPG